MDQDYYSLLCLYSKLVRSFMLWWWLCGQDFRWWILLAEKSEEEKNWSQIWLGLLLPWSVSRSWIFSTILLLNKTSHNKQEILFWQLQDSLPIWVELWLYWWLFMLDISLSSMEEKEKTSKKQKIHWSISFWQWWACFSSSLYCIRSLLNLIKITKSSLELTFLESFF